MTVNSPHRQIPESFASPRLQIRKRKHSRVELILLSPAYTAVSNATTGVFRRVPQCTYVVSQVFLMWCPLGCCGGGVGRPKWANSHDRNGLKFNIDLHAIHPTMETGLISTPWHYCTIRHQTSLTGRFSPSAATVASITGNAHWQALKLEIAWKLSLEHTWLYLYYPW